MNCLSLKRGVPSICLSPKRSGPHLARTPGLHWARAPAYIENDRCDAILGKYLSNSETFLTSNSLHMRCFGGVSKILELVWYFLSFKWISTCLPNLIPNWTVRTSNRIQTKFYNFVGHFVGWRNHQYKSCRYSWLL